jgi:hypothetical protein
VSQGVGPEFKTQNHKKNKQTDEWNLEDYTDYERGNHKDAETMKKDQTVKDHENILRNYEWNMQDIWDTMKKPNLWLIGIEEGGEIQTKSIDNLFNRIIAIMFPNPKKEKVIQVHEAYRAPNHQTKKETPPDIS